MGLDGEQESQKLIICTKSLYGPSGEFKNKIKLVKAQITRPCTQPNKSPEGLGSEIFFGYEPKIALLS